MQNDKKDIIERIMEKAQKLAPEGKDFVAGYILGMQREREEQEKRKEVEQTA